MSPTSRTPAWTLIQALEVLRRIGEHVSTDFTFHEGDGEPIVTSAASVAVLKQTGADLIDEATQLENLVERLPDADIRVTAEDVQTGAARQLKEGILDARTALLAAGVLPVAVGWPALASALRHSDAHRFWNATTVADLLGRFRGADPEAVGRVLQQAQVGSSTLWVALAARTVARLAEILAAGADAGTA
ncbi:MAG TPA: hypothetical protein VFU94_10615 [Conexibacter sp.]|nr:hypothetical protein [Conexibacter sp.]